MKDTTRALNEVITAAARGDDLSRLADKVLGLQTADKYRLAAALLDFGRPHLAEAVATRATQEIELARLFGPSPKDVAP